MVFLEDRFGILHWKPFWGTSVRPLGAKTGTRREAGGDSVTLFCPFLVKDRKGQEEKVFLVPFLYMRPPSSHTWALLCTPGELGQLHNVHGVPLSETGGVLPGTREVGGADQTAALTVWVDAFWLRWEKEARSDMSHKVEAEARKLAEGENVASESSAGKKSSVVPGKRSRGRPPKAPGRVPGVTPAGQTSEVVRLQLENELLKGKVALLEDEVAERDAQLVAVCRERQRADELLKERDSQLMAERTTSTKRASAWRSREKNLLGELEAVRGQRGTKRTAPEPVAVQDTGAAEDKAWLTQCAVELRTGQQQGATATAVVEDSLKRVDKEAAPPPSSLGAGRTGEEVRCRRHRATAKEERGNRARDPNGGVAAVLGIWGLMRCRRCGEVVGGDRMVMVLVSDGDRMVMLLVGDGDWMVMVFVGHTGRMVMVLVGDGDRMVTV